MVHEHARVRALLFDLDGTLIDAEHDAIAAMAIVLERDAGVVVTQADRDFVVGRSWRAIHANLQRQYPRLALDESELVARVAIERERILHESGLTILPGARDCLARFADWPCALVTGSCRAEVEHVLSATGWASVFHAIVASEDVSESKPSPEGYLAAAHALGLAPGTCLVIEDSTPGIAAGLAAGARVVGVRAGNFFGHDQSRAHRVLDSLDELTPALVASL